MKKPKTLAERERKLQALMATPDGRAALEGLADGYRDGGRPRPPKTSVITYILVHEREQGLLKD